MYEIYLNPNLKEKEILNCLWDNQGNKYGLSCSWFKK